MAEKLGLENINSLLAAVDHPQRQWPAIHIAGTNGKGSTAAILAAILESAGYRTGLYTSPHLVDFNERIQINRQKIDNAAVVEFTGKVRPLIERIVPSFFEVTTAMAFWHFARSAVDVAVVETGMGGRLDSTNVVDPLVSIITPIAMDHQQYLGNSLAAIAAEKGGIIKSGIDCITSNRDPEVLTVLSEISQKKASRLLKSYDNNNCRDIRGDIGGTTFTLETDRQRYENLRLNLPGEYQLDNAVLAIAALSNIKDKLKIPVEAIREGMANVSWPGRIDLVSKAPPVIIDVSHNPAGLQKTLGFLKNYYSPAETAVITFLQEDKDALAAAELLGAAADTIFLVDLKAGKPLPAENYLQAFSERRNSLRSGVKVVATVAEALEKIERELPPETLRLIIGSHYLAGEAYRIFQFS